MARKKTDPIPELRTPEPEELRTPTVEEIRTPAVCVYKCPLCKSEGRVFHQTGEALYLKCTGHCPFTWKIER